MWASKYPQFEASEESGTGDADVALPGTAGLFKLKADGDTFDVRTIDADGDVIFDVLFGRGAPYSGTVVYGAERSPAPDAAGLRITADGDWAVSVAPAGAASALPVAGVGSGAYLHDSALGQTAVFTAEEYRINVFSMARPLGGFEEIAEGG